MLKLAAAVYKRVTQATNNNTLSAVAGAG